MMTELPDHIKEKIEIAIQADRVFNDFIFQMTPKEAMAFALESDPTSSASREQFTELVREINRRIPVADRGTGHPQTGREHHHFRVGREVSRRVVFVLLQRINLSPAFNPTSLLEDMERLAKDVGALCEVISGEHSLEIMFWWV